jgi:hypothetical protein
MEDIPELVWREEEDGEAILEKYIEYMAIYGSNYTPFDICKQLFANLYDPYNRACQAAQMWTRSLEINERIRQLRLYRSKPKEEKEQYKDVLKSIYEDRLSSSRDRINALRLAAELDGYVIKAVDKKVTKDVARATTFIFKEYEDE